MAQPSLSSDLAHTNAKECCRLAPSSSSCAPWREVYHNKRATHVSLPGLLPAPDLTSRGLAWYGVCSVLAFACAGKVQQPGPALASASPSFYKCQVGSHQVSSLVHPDSGHTAFSSLFCCPAEGRTESVPRCGSGECCSSASHGIPPRSDTCGWFLSLAQPGMAPQS